MKNDLRRKNSVIGAYIYVGFSLLCVIDYIFSFINFMLNNEKMEFSDFVGVLKTFITFVLSFYFCLKIIRKPFTKAGKICYRTGEIIYLLIHSCLNCILYIVCCYYCIVLFNEITILSSILNSYLFEILIKSYYVCIIFSLLFSLVSLTACIFFAKSLRYKKHEYLVKYEVVPMSKQRIDIDTMYTTEKLKKTKQLKSLNILNEKQYNENTNKFSRGV